VPNREKGHEPFKLSLILKVMAAAALGRNEVVAIGQQSRRAKFRRVPANFHLLNVAVEIAEFAVSSKDC
jgi:hypothetical protein